MAGIDYAQTHKAAHKIEGTKELNPLLDKNPSRNSLAAFGVAGVLATYGVQKLLPDGKLKDVAIDSILETEKLNIEENKHYEQHGKRKFPGTIMLKLKFTW